MLRGGRSTREDSDPDPVDGSSKVYSCPTCGKTFGRRDYLERHILNHQKPSEVCPQCGKAFARADVLRKHLSTSCPASKAQRTEQAGVGDHGIKADRDPGSDQSRSRVKGAADRNQRSFSRDQSSDVDMSKQGSPRVQQSASGSAGGMRPPKLETKYVNAGAEGLGDGAYAGYAGPGTQADHRQGLQRWPRSRAGSGTFRTPDMSAYNEVRSLGSALDQDRDRDCGRGSERGRERREGQKRRRSSPNGSYISTYTDAATHTSTSNYWTKGLSEGLHQHGGGATSDNLLASRTQYPHQHHGGHPHPPPAGWWPSPGSAAYSQTHAPASAPYGRGIAPPYTHSIPASVGAGTTDGALGQSVNPDLIGENMGELLQWLFQPPEQDPVPFPVHPPTADPASTSTSTAQPSSTTSSGFPNSSGGIQASYLYDAPFPRSGSGATTVPGSVSGNGTTPTNMHPMDGPTGSQDFMSMSMSTFATPPHPTDPSSQSPHKGNTAPLPISFVAPFPPVPVQDGQTKEPQPIHPYTHPNKWKAGLFPPFAETAPRRPMPPGREVLSEVVRVDMLRLFEANEADAKVLSLDHMRYYLDLFFVHFASLYPIIHRASLPYRSLAPDMLLAMISIGAAYANDREALRTACKSVRRLRHRIYMCLEEEARAPVSVLQTALLVNHFSRSYGDAKHFDSGQLFHPPSIIACRLSGVFLPKFTPPGTDGSIDPLAYWLEWVEEEERKRIGYFAFMMDIENVALFKQLLQLQCVSLQTEMPLGTGPWNANDPYEWNDMLRTYPLPLSFRTSLRHVISLGFIPPNLDDSHLWLVLHGLLSTSCTLLWRDMGDLSMIQDTHLTQWKGSMRSAFDTWRNYLIALNSSAHLAASTSRSAHSQASVMNGMTGPSGALADPNSSSSVPQYTPIGSHLSHHTAQIPMVRKIGIPLCIMGCIVLLTDTEQVRIYAGATSISGRPIAPGEWTAASAYVNTWARSQDGAYACHYAALLLDEVYKADWTSSPTIIPWCAYVASLVIWTYANILDGCATLAEPFVRFTPSGHARSSSSSFAVPAAHASTIYGGMQENNLGLNGLDYPAQQSYSTSDRASLDAAHPGSSSIWSNATFGSTTPYTAGGPNVNGQLSQAGVTSTGTVSKAHYTMHVDPVAAGQAAEAYISNILACPHPFSLPDIPKSRCGGVIAYAAQQLGLLDKGMLSECYGVLEELLKDGVVK